MLVFREAFISFENYFKLRKILMRDIIIISTKSCTIPPRITQKWFLNYDENSTENLFASVFMSQLIKFI